MNICSMSNSEKCIISFLIAYGPTCQTAVTYYYYIRGLRVFSRCEDVAKDRNTRGTSIVWTVGNGGDLMHGVCIPHSIPRAWKQQR